VNTAAALLLLAVLAHLAPEHIARALGHSHTAWESALYGLEAAAVWLAIGSAAAGPLQAVAAYGAMESAQRAACRVALPMDRPPGLRPDENLCDRVTGQPASLYSLVAAALVALHLAQASALGAGGRHVH
jgi:hypothetical protein